MDAINPKRYAEIYGLDLSENALKIAKKTFPNFNFVQGDTFNLPFKNNYFNLVVSSELIEHLPNDKKFIGEISRTLDENGILILTTSNWYSLFGLFRIIGEKISKKDLHAGNQPIDNWYTSKKLKNLFKNNFEILDIKGSWYLPPFGKGKKKIPTSFIFPIVKFFTKIDNKFSYIFPEFGHIILIKAKKKSRNKK